MGRNLGAQVGAERTSGRTCLRVAKVYPWELGQNLQLFSLISRGSLPKACHTAPRPCAEHEGSPKPQKLSVKRSGALLQKSPQKADSMSSLPSRLLATSGPLLSSFRAGIFRPMCGSVLVSGGNSHSPRAVIF